MSYSEHGAARLYGAAIDLSGQRRFSFSRLIPFSAVRRIVLGFDVLIIVLASLLAGLAYHFLAFGQTGEISTYIAVGLLIASNFVGISAARGNYGHEHLLNLRRQSKEVTLTWILVCLLLIAVTFSLKIGNAFSRGTTISLVLGGPAILVVWRYCVSLFLKKAFAKGAFAERNVVIIADDAGFESSQLIRQLRSYGYRPVGLLHIDSNEINQNGIRESVAAPLNRLLQATRSVPVDAIFLLVDWNKRRCIEELSFFTRVLPLPVHLLPDENVLQFLIRPGIQIGGAFTAELKRAPLTKTEQALKRAIDVVVALIGVLMFAPLLLITACLVRLDSPGPIFFKQVRNGFNGRSFRIVKFRTMSVTEDGATIRQARRNDPRVTRIGRVLRRSSIDELPQLFNVLRGDMSLVGPRPHARAHDTEYQALISDYAFRQHVKPGITGWAQVNGYRGETETTELMAKRIEHDLHYTNNWTIWLDFRIIFGTIIVALKQDRAY
jgi:Undecaprenyl-phosphate glucose phosphotransferase